MKGVIAHVISYNSIIEAVSKSKTAMIHLIAVYIFKIALRSCII